MASMAARTAMTTTAVLAARATPQAAASSTICTLSQWISNDARKSLSCKHLNLPVAISKAIDKGQSAAAEKLSKQFLRLHKFLRRAKVAGLRPTGRRVH